MLSEKGKKTIQKVKEALEKQDIAGVPEVIKLIQELSAKAFTITVKELSDLISRDVSVTAKVLSAANTLAYNPSGISISTVSQAIQAIGFNKIRNLAISLLLVENAEQNYSPEEQREASSKALTSGLIAQSVAEKLSGLDPEQAFVCASLRNYGRLLMTTFLLDLYREAMELSSDLGDDAAFREIFGITPLTLGFHLLNSKNLPKEIMKSLQEINPSLITHSVHNIEEELLVTAEFSLQLSDLISNPMLNKDQFLLKANKLGQQFSKNINVGKEDLRDICKEVNANIRSFISTYNIKSLSNHVVETLQARARNIDPIVYVSPAHKSKKTESLSPAHKSSGNRIPKQEPPEKWLTEAMVKFTQLLAHDPVVLTQAYSLLLGTLKNAYALNNVILFLPDNEQTYSAQFGAGNAFSGNLTRPKINKKEKSIFGIALNRHEDILIDDATSHKIIPLLPKWIRALPDVKSFIIMPLLEDKKPYAFVWGSHSSKKGIQLTTKEIVLIKALRIHTGTARSLSLK